MHRARQAFSTGPAPLPQQTAPVGGMPGVPAIVNARLLTDKRHALVEDAEGNVACWDLVYGVCVEEYGQVDFKYVVMMGLEQVRGEYIRVGRCVMWCTCVCVNSASTPHCFPSLSSHHFPLPPPCHSLHLLSTHPTPSSCPPTLPSPPSSLPPTPSPLPP